MNREHEFRTKHEQIVGLLEREGLAGLVLGRLAGVAWASCGGDAHVILSSEFAFGTLLFTRERAYALATSIEMPRLMAEEFAGLPLEPIEYPWHQPEQLGTLIERLASGPVGGDIAMPGIADVREAVASLRATLLPVEQQRYRDLGAAAGAAISAACGEVAPGMTEHAIAGVLTEECYLRGITPVVVLVATDERISQFRHPIPTTKPIERYAMLVLCARRHGLIANVTRLLHFGVLPDNLRERMQACARVDGAMLAATRPNATMGQIFDTLSAAYAAEGFADEWQRHHQGGPTGYESREFLALPHGQQTVQVGQPFAWNPSITGVKSEDTILLGSDKIEVLTTSPGWPTLSIEVNGQTFVRPAILELEPHH